MVVSSLSVVAAECPLGGDKRMRLYEFKIMIQ